MEEELSQEREGVESSAAYEGDMVRDILAANRVAAGVIDRLKEEEGASLAGTPETVHWTDETNDKTTKVGKECGHEENVTQAIVIKADYKAIITKEGNTI